MEVGIKMNTENSNTIIKPKVLWKGYTCPSCEFDYIVEIALAQNEGKYCPICEDKLGLSKMFFGSKIHTSCVKAEKELRNIDGVLHIYEQCKTKPVRDV